MCEGVTLHRKGKLLSLANQNIVILTRTTTKIVILPQKFPTNHRIVTSHLPKRKQFSHTLSFLTYILSIHSIELIYKTQLKLENFVQIKFASHESLSRVNFTPFIAAGSINSHCHGWSQEAYYL